MALMDVNSNGNFEEVLHAPVTQQPPPPSSNTADDARSAHEKKVIKTGELAFKVEDSQQTYQSVLQQMKKQGAYVENESQMTEYDRKHIRMKVRVPSEKFDSLFNGLASQATVLDERVVKIEDVTEAYYDLQSRIKNKKALEARYVDLLKKANSIKDMLEIEKNLNELRTEIESLEGRFRYLGNQVRLSTIHLNFYELLPYTYSAEVRPGFGARLKESLSKGWQVFLSFLVGMIGLWPFLLLLAEVIFGLRKWRRKRVKATK